MGCRVGGFWFFNFGGFQRFEGGRLLLVGSGALAFGDRHVCAELVSGILLLLADDFAGVGGSFCLP